ncbi:cation:proton antiporter [Rubrivirga litoralis]|uniref:Cation:proton antiporter n=1 Tax=Rubrivirga litoralis TaxID=3075598 RepID=A0ABU3BTD6_9BACT|nr:cation:proton antiporter [Rubrivirga sp. F394]MDT0632495.1 cation:proton antiporter [Rubrivirga sp. F394]
MPAPPLAAGPLPFVGELAALFAAGVVVAYLCYRVRLVPIAGFLLAGVVIGPEALGLVRDVELVAQLAEVGVIILLFSIGVEFSLAQMARLARPIFLGGGLQVALTIGAVTGGLLLLDVGVGPAVFTGFLVSLSSTAIVLKVLGERAETDTPVGRVVLAMILFQDLVIVVMVLLIPALAGEGGSALDVAWALGKAALVIAAVLVGARRVVPALLERVAETRRTELFLLAVAAVCLGTAWAVSLAGVSLAIGAFLAGLLVSESDYAEHALSEILPLQTLFTAAFFLSVGMLLDPAFLWANLGLVAAVAAVVLVAKAAVAAFSARLLGSPLGVALAVGLALAQIGEFSFVLALAGADVGLLPGGVASGDQILIAVTVVLMLATPGLVALGPRLSALGRRVETAAGVGGAGGPNGGGGAGHGHGVDLQDHTVVVGYGLAGRRLARVLGESGIPYAVSDLNPRSLREAHADGAVTVYGDASREPILRGLGVERAKLLVVAINDGDATRRITAVARHLNPTLQILARTRFVADVEPLTRAGADVVVPEEMETTVRLFTHVLGAYLVPRDEIERQAALVRQDDYGVLRGSIQEAHLMVLQGLDEEGLHTRAVAVRDGAPAAGRTLAELRLRQDHGLTVMAVRRGRETVGSPAGEFRVEPGDRLVMVGSADQFAHSADLFRAPPPDGPPRPAPLAAEGGAGA